MSRIVVKNLPKDIKESKLRRIFSQKGNITDVQLKYTPSGKFRQFAFIGYHDENEAAEAIKSFNNTHIKTNKVIVELCSLLGDRNKPKSWSKYAKDSTAYKLSHPEIEVEEETKKSKTNKKDKSKNKLKILEKYKNDSEFAEFMQLHAPEDAKLLNNSEHESEGENEDTKTEEDTNLKLAHQKISDAEYLKSLNSDGGENLAVAKKLANTGEKSKINLFTLKLKNLPYKLKKKDIKDFFRNTTPFSIRIPRGIKGIAYVTFKTESRLTKALLKDRSFLGGKQITVMKYGNCSNENEIDHKKSKWTTQEEALKHEEGIAESGRIFIRNLSYTTTENDIQELFSKYGTLTEVTLPVDFTTRIHKGFGIITFLIPEQAVAAYTELDGTILHGRMLHLLPGKGKNVSEDENEEGSNYKKKKAEKQKAQAAIGHNWNSLFVGSNAIADVMAKTYGTTKHDLLSSDGRDNAAVRLALGETKIVANIKEYLEQHGVNLDAFSNTNNTRSKTIILVKDLPADTDISEIREMFEKYGVIGRLIFPPNGLTAIVDFVEPSEARKAYTSLAYTKFKDRLLLLQWAPETCLTSNKPSKVPDVQKEEIHKPKEKLVVEDVVEEEEEEEDEPEPDTTLYVKNLNFRTTDEELREHFKKCGKLYYAKVTTRKDPSNPQNQLSSGYGFVRFYRKDGINKALKLLQGSTLDGKTLELKRSEKTLQNQAVSGRKKANISKQTGAKILIRNIPFQAKKKEIKELFEPFGEIRALRLPQKMSLSEDNHRGFAFVDFVTATDAKKAFTSLSQSTHLYGRRLILEWANQKEEVSSIRKRTADHFHTETEVTSKKGVADINL